MQHHFPQYRKLSNNKVFYKVLGEDSFEEIKLMGKKVFHYTIVAKQYPELLKIKDMLNFFGYEFLEQNEWEELKSLC